MKITGPGKLLRIFIGESDHWEGQPLYHAIVIKLKEHGFAGATVVRGIEGFGAHSRLHTTRILRLSEDLPIVIEVADRPERIDEALQVINGMIDEGMVTVEDVHILKYTHREDEQTS